jgi:hypothetical protein
MEILVDTEEVPEPQHWGRIHSPSRQTFRSVDPGVGELVPTSEFLANIDK